MFRRPRHVLALAFLSISIPLTLWGFWPPAREVREIPLQVLDSKLSLPEARTIRLEYSPAPRLGDAQIMELRIVRSSEVAEANNLYEEYSVIAEARLDMPLAEVRPAGLVSAPLTAGGSATFYWEVSPRVEGALDGTVWVYLRFMPREGGEERREVVSAQGVAIRPRSVLGRGGSQARAAGVVGLTVGILLGVAFVRKRRATRS